MARVGASGHDAHRALPIRAHGALPQDRQVAMSVTPWRPGAATSPNGHMSRSPLLVAGALELSDKMAGPLMAGHRFTALGSSDSGARLGDLPARSMPTSGLVRDTFLETGGTWLKRLAPGDPLTSPGPWDLLSKIRVPVPACFPGRATRRAASVKPAVRAGMGGRGLSHLQELPLISAGSRRALARTGDLRAAGVTNGQSDGGAIEPFH
jgi:hypothetical protein